MFVVDRDHIDEVATGLFGGGRLVYTKQVKSGPKFGAWILRLKQDFASDDQFYTTRLIASMTLTGWNEVFEHHEVLDQLYLLALRDDQMVLTTCNRVDRRQHRAGVETLLFTMADARVVVGDSPEAPGPVMSSKRLWTDSSQRKKW